MPPAGPGKVSRWSGCPSVNEANLLRLTCGRGCPGGEQKISQGIPTGSARRSWNTATGVSRSSGCGRELLRYAGVLKNAANNGRRLTKKE